MLSVRTQIVKYLQKRGTGRFVFPSDFRALGNTNAIKEVLAKLVLSGILVRLAHGVYYYPKTDPELGILYPNLHDIAYAIARRDGVIITPTADYALNALGLSQQVPVNVVYLSSGRSKNIKVGKNQIVFKQASSRRAHAGKHYMGLVVRSLEGIGADKLTTETLATIHEKMQEVSDMEILTAAKKAPLWIADILTNFVKKRINEVANTDA